MKSSTSNLLQAVIIGAGPYGLSMASHFREAGVPFRIFGRPMQSWATQMPAGMKLKSHGFSTSLSSGSVPFTLEDFCRLHGRTYHATRIPIPLESFIEYGREFARRFVPDLEAQNVVLVEKEGDVFRLTTESGERLLSRRVILALGLSLFQHMPEILSQLPGDLVTHTTAHRSFAQFRGRDVTVLGRGDSSLTTAALLDEAGARVTLIARSERIHIDGSLRRPRSLYQRIRYPATPLGPSFRSWFFCAAPGAFGSMPASVRKMLVYKHLGPAGSPELQQHLDGKFPVLLGWDVESAELIDAEGPADRRVRLVISQGETETREHITSHVIAGTGFRPDMERIRFLSRPLRQGLAREIGGWPRLSRSFATSVPGMYMVGPLAAATFGPLLRYAAGAEFAAHRVTQRLAAEMARSDVRADARAPLPLAASASGERIF